MTIVNLKKRTARLEALARADSPSNTVLVGDYGDNDRDIVGAGLGEK